jgi:lactoylglutathione lyase
LFTDEEIGTTCCFATQDKVWVTGPAGEKWEFYTVLADSLTFGSSPLDRETEDAACCGGSPVDGDQGVAASCC